MHIREIGLHKQEVVRWCLNVCVTIVTRNGSDSHQKNNNIRDSTVVCSVMHSTGQVLAEHITISSQISLPYKGRFTFLYCEHFHNDTFFYKSVILL